MGTRALIHIEDGDEIICTIYRQYDGYPTGLGDEVKQFLGNGDGRVVNGISNAGGAHCPAQFNGMGCLAAWLIAQLKDGIGGIYMERPGAKNIGEEYVYRIYEREPGNVDIRVDHMGRKIYAGLLKEFDPKKVEDSAHD